MTQKWTVSRLVSFLRQLWQRKLKSFTIIGVSLTIFGAIFIEVSTALGGDPYWANLIQAIISVALNFYWNRKTTWRDRRGRRLRMQIVRFALAKAVSLPLNQFLFAAAIVVFDFHLGFLKPYISNTSFAYWTSTGLIMLYNLVTGEWFVFREKPRKNSQRKEQEE